MEPNGHDISDFDDDGELNDKKLEHKTSKFVRRYVGCLERTKYFVIFFWIAMLGVGIFSLTQFLKQTSNVFQAPKGSRAYEAQQEMDRYFPGSSNLEATLLFIEAELPNDNVISPDVSAFVKSMEREFWEYTSNPVVEPYSFDSYFTHLKDNPIIAESFKQPTNNRTTFALMTILKKPESGIKKHSPTEFVKHMRKVISDLNPPNSGFSADLTGQLAFNLDVDEGTEKDMTLTDGISLPIALILLAITVKSFAVSPVPLLTMGSSASLSFLIMFFVSLSSLKIVSFCPSLMLSTTIAMSVDYSLFLLSRFSEEVRRGREIREAVENTVESAGHTVLVSGATLAACFYALIVFPLDLMRSAGLGAGLAVTITIVDSLSFIPAVLLAFGPTLARYLVLERSCRERVLCLGDIFRCRCKRACCPPKRPQDIRSKQMNAKERRESAAADHLNDSLLSDHYIAHDDAVSQNSALHMRQLSDFHEHTAVVSSSINTVGHKPVEEQRDETRSCCFRIGRCSTRFPINLIILICVVAAAAPICSFAVGFKKSASFMDYVPRGARSTDTYTKMAKIYSSGALFPYALLIVNRNHQSFLSFPDIFDGGFFEAADVSTRFVYHSGVDPNSAVGVVFEANSSFTQELLELGILEFPQTKCSDLGKGIENECRALRYLRNEYMSGDGVATYVDVSLPMNPYSQAGHNWLKRARELLDSLKPEYMEFDMYLTKGDAVNYDAIQKVYNLLPIMMGVTAVVVFIIVGGVFKSAMLPLLAVLLLCLTVSLVFGWGVLVYQHDALTWIGLDGLKGNGALSWFTPIMAFSVLVGLALDYMIFLLTRVVEYRKLGVTDSDSLVMALHRIGGVIGSAGLIMSVAFGGLTFSTIEILNQLSLFLVTSVLFSTFMVACILLPAVISLLSRFNINWWPTKMPPAKLRAEDMLEYERHTQ